MYFAGDAFRSAVYERNPAERILLRMPGLCLTAEDLTGSLTYTEGLNNEEELTIGECPASTLALKIRNDHGLLTDYAFTGECHAMIGVRTQQEPGAGGAPYAILRYGGDQPVTFRGGHTEPWLTINGEAPTIQPPFPVHAVIIEGNRVYCVSESGAVWGAAWVDGREWGALASLTWGEIAAEKWDSIQGYLAPLTASADWDALASKTWDELEASGIAWSDFVSTIDVIPFMQAKLTKWAAAGRGVWHDGNTVYEFGKAIEKYEYVPLGIFLPDKPKKRRVTRIEFNANDRMVLFDADATEFLAGIAYPTTTGEVLAALCEYVGVALVTPTFINSTRLIEEPLFDGEAVTCRDILRWIAEAACAYGRMTRDGELELAWFGTEAADIPMTQYFDIDVAEYQVMPIDKLQIAGSEADIGVIIGEGANGYQIMDNPYLYGASDAEIRVLGVPIYNRLAAFAAFSPIKARAVCDWSIQAGDIIRITLNGTAYALPVYRQTITWNGGGCRVTYESTGSAYRPVMSAANRRIFNQKRAMHELTVNVDGLTSRIIDVEGDVAELRLTADGLALSVSNSGTSSTLTLKSGETELSSAEIVFNGYVTFANLSTEGQTTINGGNVTTDNLYVKHLEGAEGTFESLKATAGGSIQMGNWYFLSDGLEYNLGSGALFDFEYLNGWAVIAGSAPMQVGPYTDGIQNRLWLVGTSVTVECSENHYPMIFGLPGTAEMSLYPQSPGTCNVGTNTYYFEYMHSIIFTQHSDRRSKTNILDLEEDKCIEFVKKIPPKSYSMITRPEITDYGFVAQDVEQAFNEVYGAEIKNGIIQKGDDSEEVANYSLNYISLIPFLTLSVQKIMERIGM